MRILKYLGFALGGLVALVLVVVAAVALFFDPNDYKAGLQQAVERRTGRPLRLEGDLTLAWFPWLAVQFGPASLGNAAGFDAAPLLEIERARLGVRLSSLLLRRRLEFDTVSLQGPVLRLAVDASGRGNWEGLGEVPSAARPEAPPEAAGPATRERPLLQASISRLWIERGRLEYLDLRDAGRFELADVAFDGRLWLDFAADRYRIEEPRLQLRLQRAPLPPDGLPVALRAAALELDLDAQTLQLRQLQAESHGAVLAGDIEGQRLRDAPRLAGPLRLAPLSPREWLARAGLEAPATRDATVLARLSFEGQLQATPDSVEMTSLQLRFDDAAVTGSAGIADFDAGALRFDLAVDRLDLDRYLPPGTAATEAAGGTKPAAVPVELLRGLDLEGSLAAGRITFGGVPLADLKLGVVARQSVLRLFPLEAGLYGGRYRGDLRVDVSGDLPRVEFDETLTGIDFAPLLHDLFESRRMSGRGDGALSGVARGRDTDALLRSATGSARFKLADGALEGADIGYEIRRARAVLARESVPARPAGPARTPFTQLQASARIGGGALRSDDLVMAMPYLRIRGRGSLGLVAQTLDWNLDADVLKDAAGDSDAPRVDFSVPVRVTGPISSPSVRPDVEGLARSRVKKELEQRRGDLEQGVRDRLRDLLKR